MKRNSKPRRHEDDGFSLVELMVVVLVIAILIVVALPTLLGTRERAADRAAQSDVRTGLAAALAYYAEQRSWDGFDAAQAAVEDANISWTDGGPPGTGEVSIQVHAGQELLLVTQSSRGSHFCLSQVAGSPGTDRGQGPSFDSVDTVAECTGGW